MRSIGARHVLAAAQCSVESNSQDGCATPSHLHPWIANEQQGLSFCLVGGLPLYIHTYAICSVRLQCVCCRYGPHLKVHLICVDAAINYASCKKPSSLLLYSQIVPQMSRSFLWRPSGGLVSCVAPATREQEPAAVRPEASVYYASLAGRRTAETVPVRQTPENHAVRWSGLPRPAQLPKPR